MSTAQQILTDIKAARLGEQVRDDAQKKLFGRCWCPRYLIVGLSIWACISGAHLGLLVAQYVKDPTHPRVGMAVVVFANLALAIGTIVTRLTRRNAALTELIRLNAPTLHRELKERRLL